MRGIHRSPVNSPHKGQWRGALMFCLICVWINGVNNRDVCDLRMPLRPLWRHCNGIWQRPMSWCRPLSNTEFSFAGEVRYKNVNRLCILKIIHYTLRLVMRHHPMIYFTMDSFAHFAKQKVNSCPYHQFLLMAYNPTLTIYYMLKLQQQ